MSPKESLASRNQPYFALILIRGIEGRFTFGQVRFSFKRNDEVESI